MAPLGRNASQFVGDAQPAVWAEPVLGSGGRSPGRTPRLAVLVKPGVAESPLPPLLFARLGKLRGWQFVIVGMEEDSTWRKYPPRHRQAWWCRVVREAPGEPASAPVAVAAVPARQDIEHESLAEPA